MKRKRDGDWPYVRTTWRDDTLEIPYGERGACASAHSSEWEPDCVSSEPGPVKVPDCMLGQPLPRGMSPEPTCLERGSPPRMAAPKLRIDETMELLPRALGAGEEDQNLSAALKAKLGLSDLNKPSLAMCTGVELLSRDVKSCSGIYSSPMDTRPSNFYPCMRTVLVCSVGDTPVVEMKSYGQAALAPLATTHPSPPSCRPGDPGAPGRGTKAIVTANLQMELPELDPKTLPERAEELFEFSLRTGQQHADVRTTCTLINKACEKNFSSGT